MTAKRWSQHVTETSHALDLQQGVFAQRDPKAIARSLKRSAEHSARLERAKGELRRLFGRQ
jgi:hypothetical protein